jgi:hypothetical protein
VSNVFSIGDVLLVVGPAIGLHVICRTLRPCGRDHGRRAPGRRPRPRFGIPAAIVRLPDSAFELEVAPGRTIALPRPEPLARRALAQAAA